MNDKSWLEQAIDVTLNSRQKEYGHPLINFLRAAEGFNFYLRPKLQPGQFINPLDIVFLMITFKIAREIEVHKDDNCVDLIGYMSCYQRIDKFMKQWGYPNGAESFRDMNENDMILLREGIEHSDMLPEG